MVEVLVEHDYIAQEPDELTIRKGDIIIEVLKKAGGWWEGKLKDKKGMFPDNFVRVIDKESVTLRNKRDVTRIRQCRVVFSYNQDHEDELNLKVGEIIDIIGEEEEGWWRGQLNGKEGVFPSNFVEEIVTPVNTNRPRPSIREDLNRLSSEPPVLPSKPAKQFCEVKFAYKALNEDELNLKEGDIVTLINKDTQDPGWWKGEINGRVGVFPDNFVVILPDDKKPINLEHKPDIFGAIKPSSIASQRKSLEVKKEEPKPSTGGAKNDSTKSENHPDPKTPPVPGKKPVVTVKKSPSSGSASGILSKIKEKIADTIDGATGSKQKTDSTALSKDNSTENNNNDAFDQVERTPVLMDVRANRARAPGRRLPTSIYKEDDEEIPGLPNGNVDHSKPEFILKSQFNKSEGAKPEVSSRPESFREKSESKSDTLESSSSSEQLDGTDIKPKTREWEKKVPWLEEMKANQAKRSSGPSPGPDPRHRLSNPLSDVKTEPEGGSKSSQNSPAEKEVHLMDMSKSMSDIKTSPLDPPKVGLRAKTPTNELERISPLKNKPVAPPASGKPHLGSLPPRDSPIKSAAPQPKLSPKPSMYENTVVSKPPIGGASVQHSSTAHSTSVLNSLSSVSHSASSHVVTHSISHSKGHETASSHAASKCLEALRSNETSIHASSRGLDALKNHDNTSNHATSRGVDAANSSHVVSRGPDGLKTHDTTSNHATRVVEALKPHEAISSHAVSRGCDLHKVSNDEGSRNYLSSVLDRLEKLENTVERQSQLIEELRNRLQVESDMRILLQEKLMQSNVQV